MVVCDIDIINLKNELNKLNSLFDTYQENYLNFYNEIKNSSVYWQDVHSTKFFKDKEVEKQKLDISFDELNSLKSVYNIIIQEYEKFGNYISFDLTYREELLSDVNVYINKVTRISNLYSSLNYSFASSSIRVSLGEQHKTINKLIKDAQTLKERLKNIMNEIDEIERKIQSKISNISISVLPDVLLEGYYR